MRTTKILTLLLCILLITLVSVLGTLAYLTDEESLTNTFTVGLVEIKVDETDTDEDGNILYDEDHCPAEGCTADQILRTEDGNQYHLIPGMRYLKDPTLTVKAGSADSYIRLILKVTHCDAVDAIIANHNLTDYADLFDGWHHDVWIYQGFTKENDEISFEFRYHQSVDGYTLETDADGNETKLEQDEKLEPLFTHIIVPSEVTNEELKALANVELIITGHAIQTVGFEDDAETGISAEAAAWSAFDAQINPINE